MFGKTHVPSAFTGTVRFRTLTTQFWFSWAATGAIPKARAANTLPNAIDTEIHDVSLIVAPAFCAAAIYLPFAAFGTTLNTSHPFSFVSCRYITFNLSDYLSSETWPSSTSTYLELRNLEAATDVPTSAVFNLTL
jgi:hypothetical protein